MRWASTIRNKKTGWAASVLLSCVLSFFVAQTAYPMQPPPEPLTIPKLRQLVSDAGIIAVGEIVSVEECESIKAGEKRKSVSAVLRVEKLLKGRDLSGNTIMIQEAYPAPDFFEPPPARLPVDNRVPEKAIVGLRAGPSRYHGRYARGDRIIVFLDPVQGTDAFAPLGSGAYDKHLCEFLIENDGIKVFYFRFADDVSAYAGSEDEFIGLLSALIDSK